MLKFQRNHSINYFGFTLIELLVVIAIVGIISGVVLASLNSARQKGVTASIKSNLRNMLVQASVFFTETGSYSNLCLDPKMLEIKDSITNAGGTVNCFSSSSTTNGLTWAVSAFINSDNTKNYSVDQNGVVVWDAVDISSSTMTWSDAKTSCESAGKRLPSVEELKTIREAYNPITTDPVYPTIFGNGGIYWSSSIRPASGYAYSLDVTNTSTVKYATSPSSLGYTHCVSSN